MRSENADMSNDFLCQNHKRFMFKGFCDNALQRRRSRALRKYRKIILMGNLKGTRKCFLDDQEKVTKLDSSLCILDSIVYRKDFLEKAFSMY